MNVAYAVAVALLDGDVLVDQFSPSRINRDDVWALIDRTITHHEKAYDNLPIDHERLAAEVRLTLDDGSTRVTKVVHPRGTGDRSLTNAEIREKYSKLTARAISTERQASIEKAVLNIDTLDDIAQSVGRCLHRQCTFAARLNRSGPAAGARRRRRRCQG